MHKDLRERKRGDEKQHKGVEVQSEDQYLMNRRHKETTRKKKGTNTDETDTAIS